MWTNECDEIIDEIHDKTGEVVVINVCKLWLGSIGQDIHYLPDGTWRKDYVNALKRLRVKVVNATK